MKYEKIKYPDGQVSVKMNLTEGYLAMRINSYEDIAMLISIAEAQKNLGAEVRDLFIPCLFGQRSDRRFQINQSFDLKIICDMIKLSGIKRIKIFDPHSDVSLALLDAEKHSSFGFVVNTVKDIKSDNLVLVSPDAGAYKKVFDFGKDLNLPVNAAVKHRDKDGKIDLKFIGDVEGKDCLIVDDLCDGGYTFELLAAALRKAGASKVYLYVSHGYFSKGFGELQKVIDHIYCTNSVKDINESYFDSYNMKSMKDFVTQYKVI